VVDASGAVIKSGFWTRPAAEKWLGLYRQQTGNG